MESSIALLTMCTNDPSTEKKCVEIDPPYCFKSIDELRKSQTRYNQYNIFHMVERLRLLQAQGTVETIESVDKSSNAYKMYKDFVVPPLPPAYEHLNLPPHWLIYMVVKKEKKRSHKKSTEELMPFQKLAQAIADAYKAIDQPTKAWLDEVSSKLLAYNKAMRDELATHLNEQSNERRSKESPASHFADGNTQGINRNSRLSIGENEPPSFPHSFISSSTCRAAMDEQIKYLQNFNAADMSLKLALRFGRLPGISNMYSGDVGVLNEDYGISPRGTTSLLSGDHSLLSRVGSLPLPFHPAQVLLRNEIPTKRQRDEEGHTDTSRGRGTKRIKTETYATDRNGIPASATSRDFHYQSVIGGTVIPHDSFRVSVFDIPLPCSITGATRGLVSLGAPRSSYPPGVFQAIYPESQRGRHEHLKLGYQLGLRAAARVDASCLSHFPDNEISARLQALRRRVSPVETFGLSNALKRSEYNHMYSEMMSASNAMGRKVHEK